MKTCNCKIATFLIALALLLSPIPSHAQRKPQKVVALTLDDVLACAHSPTMLFLKRSVDQIREISTKTEGQTSYYERQVEIHWLDTDDEADILSFAERKFCNSGSLEFVAVPQGLQSVRYASTIYRAASHSYNLSLQQVYSSNRRFLQERGALPRSSRHLLTITIEPVQCNTQAASKGVPKSSHKTWKSEIGVSIQWEQGKSKNDWVFYRAMYDSPGCDSEISQR
jgi:hypothetical protein